MAENTKTYNIKIDGIKENVDGIKSLKDQTTDYSKVIREATKEIKQIQGEMHGLEKGSKQWTELAKRAGEAKDRIDDIREATRRYASDTKGLDDVINLAKSATAAFTLCKGAMSAFGMETEEAEKAIQQLAGAMSIIQSLQTLQNTLKGSSATATLFTKAMNLLTLGIKGTTTASKTLKIALASIGIGLVIAAVSALVEHWDELVGWFTKTFPALKNLSTWFDKVRGAVAGLGNAVWAAIKNLGMIPELIQAIFTGNFEKAIDIYKNAFNNIVNGFKTGYADKMADIQEGITLKQTQEENKRTKHQLEMLKAQKGNAAKYSKEGIALQKKDFEERKKLAKGNKDELNKIAVEEANFYRECQESKSAAAKKAANDAKKAAKERADAAKKRAEEERKEEEKRQKLHLDALESLYEAEHNMAIHEAEQRVKEAEKLVEQFKDGPEELLKKAIDDLTAAQLNLLVTQVDGVWKSAFNNVHGSVSAVTTDLESFKQTILDVGAVIGKKDEGLDFDVFKDAAKNVKALANLSEDELRIVYASYLDIAREFDGTVTQMTDTQAEAAKKTEESVKRIREKDKAEQEKILSKEREAIELTTLKFEEEEDKKSENAQRLLALLKAQWDTYLAHVKGVYTEDSKEYLEAQKKKKQAIGDDKKKQPSGNQFMDFEDNGGVNWGDIKKTIEDAYEAYAAPIVKGLSNTIGMMMDFAIEEAENALEEAEELHDKAVDKVNTSKSKLTEINNEMATASATRLEQLKAQQADEMLLLAQREAEEKRAEREKERREKELENKKKQQRKMELKVQMAEALVSGALAAVNGFATKPFIPVGLAMGALATTLTAAQIAIMAKQMSKMADGGLLQGRSHAQGGIPIGNTGIEVEGGEYVINKRSTKKYLPLLQQINAEGARKKTVANQIGKMANGGELNYERVSNSLSAQDINKVIQSSIGTIDIHPVVSVVDINRGQKNLVNVRQIAGASN